MCQVPSLPYLVGLLGVGGKEASIHSAGKAVPSYCIPHPVEKTSVPACSGSQCMVSGRPGPSRNSPKSVSFPDNMLSTAHSVHWSSDLRKKRQLAQLDQPGPVGFQCCLPRLRPLLPSLSTASLPFSFSVSVLGRAPGPNRWAGLGLKVALHPCSMWYKVPSHRPEIQ